MDRLRDLYSDRIQKILRSAENIMEGIANVFLFHQGMMRRINARFFATWTRGFRTFAENMNPNRNMPSSRCSWVAAWE